MADEIHHPHDMMVHAVLCDLPEATSFLQAYLAEDVSQRLNWATLRLLEGSMEQVAGLLVSLSSLPPSGGVNYVRIFVLYILETQAPEAAQLFREVLRQHAPSVGDDLMTTYAQELLAEGRAEGEQKGTIRTQVEVIEGFLREGVEWPVIERATGVNEVQFQALKQQVEAMDE